MQAAASPISKSERPVERLHRSSPGPLAFIASNRVVIDATTPLTRLHQISDLLEVCEMMLPMERFVRGQARPSVYLAALDADGRPVAHASSSGAYHASTPNGLEAHWGMLATLPERRGQGLAAYLGALAMVRMYQLHGYTVFSTGIREGNIPSERLCASLGLRATQSSILLSIDPAAFDGGAITK